ncbi:endonuclease V [Oricola sp.]|uniref:endonuclease V n=1 Tax=Oricola sp. TaxID=1979950 RepID=UPI0025E2A31E|nr:endonuclease V [Oricola sp.]MCI5074944.1 endonuclease V [Oricola sp.]
MTSEGERGGPVAVLDAAYGDTVAAGGCVLISEFSSSEPLATHQVRLPMQSAEYEPGAFYKRELPVLLALLDAVSTPVATIVIDGYVHLDGAGRPGLGARLAAALDRRVAVIGVAKTPFRGDDWSRPVCRGESRQPLRVTAIGVDLDTASRWVAEMHGAHRIPVMCRLADRLARDALAG